MNKVYVLVHVDSTSEIDIDVKTFSDKDDAMAYAMEQLFGEDWEAQMSDENWERQPELFDAWDSIQDYGYTDEKEHVWQLFETGIDETIY